MAQPEKAEPESRVAEEPVSVSPGDETASIYSLEPLIILARRKSFILKFVGSAAVLSVVVSFLLPKSYTANAQIMPPQASQSMNMAMLNQLGPLAALAGTGLARNQSDLYVSMMQSRTVADALIDRFSLMQVYDMKLREKARLELADRTTIISSRKDGVISISVTDRDPQRAADLANAYADELSKLTKTLAVTEAARRRMFFEQEVKKSGDELAVAEEALKETQEKTGLILLSDQSKAMIEALTSVRARIAAKEVEMQAMRSFATPENPDLVRAQQELAALRAQAAKLETGQSKGAVAEVPIGNVPAAGLEYVRKLREVKYHEALLELLWKEYELARIDEGRDPVLVQQLDKAVRPERRSWPQRGLLVLTMIVLASLVAIGASFLDQSLERAREDPEFTARLRLLKFYLRGRDKS